MVLHIRFWAFFMVVILFVANGNRAAVTVRNFDNDSIIEALFTKGTHLNQNEQYDSARIVFNEALKINGGPEWMNGRILLNIGKSYIFQGKNVEALKYFFEALHYAEKDPPTHARALSNIAECYYLIGNLGQSLLYAQQADDILLKTGNLYFYYRPSILYTMGKIYLEQNEPDRAEEKMQETIMVADSVVRAEKSDDMLWYKGFGMNSLAKIYLARGDIQKAEEYVYQGLRIGHEYKYASLMANSYAILSGIYLAQKQYEQSRDAENKALAIYPNAVNVISNLAYNIATTSMYLGEYEKAEENYRLYRDLVKKRANLSFQEQIAGMEIQYEVEKKDLRISFLERDRRLYFFFSIVTVLSAFFAIMFLRQRLRHKRQEQEIIEAKALAKGILEGETKERERLAIELHHGVQGSLIAIKLHLNSNPKVQQMIQDVIEEVHRMVDGLMSKSLKEYGLCVALTDYCLKFPNISFQSYGADRRAPESIENLIYRCAQELITNSVKHAEAKKINVQLAQDEKHIHLTVYDDGKGYDRTKDSSGIGLRNIRNWVEAFNGKMDIASSPATGTETTITVAIEEKT